MTIPAVFTHINLLHSALLWAVIWPPFPLHPSPCDWMPGSIPGLMGPGRGQHEAGNRGGFWWWPAVWKVPAHPSRQSLSSRLIRPSSGCELMFTVCWGVVKLTLLIAVITAFFIPIEPVGERVVGNCVGKGGKVYRPYSESCHSIDPVCKSVFGIVWQSNIEFAVLCILTHPSCTSCENAGLWLLWIFQAVCGAWKHNHIAVDEPRLFILLANKIPHNYTQTCTCAGTHTEEHIKFLNKENKKTIKNNGWTAGMRWDVQI